MALLNRFSKLNDRGETGIFTFIVTKSVTRDFHRDATTKDFCFGYHRWAISFQRPAERILGVHLLLRNPSPSTSCVVDFTLALLNREHFSQNEIYSKRQAKFTITNPMQGVSRWIQMSELNERRFSNETGEFLFELTLSNMRTIFECDIQLNPNTLTIYKSMLKSRAPNQQQVQESPSQQPSGQTRKPSDQLINLETNCFTFGSFEWSLTIVPLVVPATQSRTKTQENNSETSSSSSNLLTPNKHNSNSSHSISSSSSSLTNSQSASNRSQACEPVCRVYLNRLNGLGSLARVRYRVILGHHQPSGSSGDFADSRTLDQISDTKGRIKGYQFRDTNIMKLISLRSSAQQQHQQQQEHHSSSSSHRHAHGSSGLATLDLRVHIEMFCANTISEAKVPLHRKANEPQVSNCIDRNKQSWCVESDIESENLRLKLFFMDLQSVPRNHIRYISWTAYVVRRDPKSGQIRDSIPVRNSPHSNYYLQDGMDLGTIMDTELQLKQQIHASALNLTTNSDLNLESATAKTTTITNRPAHDSPTQMEQLTSSPLGYLEANELTVHIEWVDSLLLFSHLYNNYDSLATIQRHQISRELFAVQEELEHLEQKYEQICKRLAERQELAPDEQLTKSHQAKSPSPSPSKAMRARLVQVDPSTVGDRSSYDSAGGGHINCRPEANPQSHTSDSMRANSADSLDRTDERRLALSPMSNQESQWMSADNSTSTGTKSALGPKFLAQMEPQVYGTQSPMSLDERLHFISSSAVRAQELNAFKSICDSRRSAIESRELPRCSQVSAAVRRRLPQQPIGAKLAISAESHLTRMGEPKQTSSEVAAKPIKRQSELELEKMRVAEGSESADDLLTDRRLAMDLMAADPMATSDQLLKNRNHRRPSNDFSLSLDSDLESDLELELDFAGQCNLLAPVNHLLLANQLRPTSSRRQVDKLQLDPQSRANYSSVNQDLVREIETRDSERLQNQLSGEPMNFNGTASGTDAQTKQLLMPTNVQNMSTDIMVSRHSDSNYSTSRLGCLDASIENLRQTSGHEGNALTTMRYSDLAITSQLDLGSGSEFEPQYSMAYESRHYEQL